MTDTDKAERLEQRLDLHIAGVNTKIDSIVACQQRMSEFVASASEKLVRSKEDINRLEDGHQENASIIQSLYNKFENKVDLIEAERKQVTSRIFDKIEETVATRSAETLHMHEDVEKDVTILVGKLDLLSEQISKLSTDYNAKTNFTRGALYVLGGILVVGQLIVVNYLNDNKDRITDIYANLKKTEQKQTETDQQVQLIQNQIIELKRERAQK